jgi:hypothetical protein
VLRLLSECIIALVEPDNFREARFSVLITPGKCSMSALA